MEVLLALREELPNIIRCLIDRLVARFESQTSIVQTVDGMVGVTQE